MNSNQKSNFPNEFYSLKVYNKLSLAVHDSLKDAFLKCDEYLINNGFNKYLNLIAVFYPHIAKLLTNYSFIKYDIMISNIETENELIDLTISDNKQSHWPINYNNVYRSHYSPIGHEYLNTWPSTNVGKIKNIIKICYKAVKTQFDHIYKNKKDSLVLMSPNAGFSPRKLSNILGIRVRDLNLNNRISIPSWNLQFNYFSEAIKNLESKIKNIFFADFEFDNNFLSFIEKELTAYCSVNSKNRMNANVLVIGSLADLKCRINAAIAKSNNIPVISIWHGDNIGEKDEPQFGPVAQTFSDIILGYGDHGCKDFLNGVYNNCLYEKPIIHPSSSLNVKNIYNGEKIERLKNIKDSIMMYVPTNFHNVERVGPFHDLHDLAYFEWQKNMLKNVNLIIKPKSLIRKQHRKERVIYDFDLDGIEQLYEQDLLELIDVPDLFIFDYPTTAFAFAAATNKPIIYIDIGLRNHMPDALQSIKDRCIYVKGEPNKSQSLVNKVYKRISKKSNNTYTKRYSLSNDKRTREEILIDIIKESIRL